MIDLFFLAQTIPSPGPTTSGGTGVDVTNTVSLLNTLTYKVTGDSWNAASDLYYNYLNLVARSFAIAIIPTVLWVEVTFCGLRIMRGLDKIMGQCADLLMKVFICYVVVILQLPQAVLIGASQELRDAGRAVGGQMCFDTLTAKGMPSPAAAFTQMGIDNSGSNTYDCTPNAAWGAWVDPDNDHTSVNYKYGYDFIRHNVFITPPALAKLAPNEEPRYQHFHTNYNYILNTGMNLLFKVDDVASLLLKSQGDTAQNQAGFLYTMSPREAFTLALVNSTEIMTGTMAPAFATMTVLSAAYYCFFVTLALGTAVTPFLFFKTFDGIWRSYLQFMMGVSLIPLFYYLFAGVGFVMATKLFGDFFVPTVTTGTNAGTNTGIANVYGSVLWDSFAAAYAASVPGDIGMFNAVPTLFLAATKIMFNVFAILGRQVGGCAIISAFIVAGATFPVGCVKMALSWDKGFTEAAIFDAVQGAFNDMIGATTSGLSQQYSSGMQVAERDLGKIIRNTVANDIWKGVGGS